LAAETKGCAGRALQPARRLFYYYYYDYYYYYYYYYYCYYYYYYYYYYIILILPKGRFSQPGAWYAQVSKENTL
jgi:hypothetical protein